MANSLNNIGAMHYFLTDKSRAVKLYKQALSISQKFGDKFSETAARSNIARVMIDNGDLPLAAEHLRLVVELDRQIQSPGIDSHAALLAQVEEQLRQQDGQ